MIQEYVNKISDYSHLIITEVRNSWNGIDFNKKEPDIIKDYLLASGKGVDYLNNSISKKITSETKYEVKFASVYCHQKPRVTRTQNSINRCKGDTKSCELGDLMTVFIFLDKNKKVVCSTAKIMQAKKNDKLNSLSQKCLYESDLEFEMPKNILLSSTNSFAKRTLPNYYEYRNHALSYLILRKGSQTIREIPSACNLIHNWECDINMMMEFKTGLKFSLPKIKNDYGWDCIVHDLLNVGTGKVPSSTKRGYGLNFFLDEFNYFYHYHEYKIENEMPSIPTIMIFCKDTEREYIKDIEQKI
jgi:hypothetical protein